MEKSKLISRYMGSMASIAVVHAIAAYFLIFRPDLIVSFSNTLAKLVPRLEPVAPKAAGTWLGLAASYLAFQGVAFFFAALFPRRWGYRALCFLSSAASAAALGTLFARSVPLAPFLVGFLWQGALALWVAWLLLLEAVQRPFSAAPPPNPSH